MIYQGKEYANFEISNSGLLKNVSTGNILKLTISKTGYYSVCISLGSRNNRKLIKIHKAIAETFIPNPHNYPCINHKDGNKLNNSINNLEWCTNRHNIIHAYQNNLIDTTKISGENHKKSKLTNEIVNFIRDNYKPRDKEFGSRALARKFNINHEVIRRIFARKMWKHI